MTVSQIVLSYPVSQGQMVNAVAIVITPNARGTAYEGPWVTESNNDEMISSFSHWDPQVFALLKVPNSTKADSVGVYITTIPRTSGHEKPFEVGNS